MHTHCTNWYIIATIGAVSAIFLALYRHIRTRRQLRRYEDIFRKE